MICFIIYGYAQRQKIKNYVTLAIWPAVDKPIVYSHVPSSRDDTFRRDRPPSPEETNDADLPIVLQSIILDIKSEEAKDVPENGDSGISGSEYFGSGKSLLYTDLDIELISDEVRIGTIRTKPVPNPYQQY